MSAYQQDPPNNKPPPGFGEPNGPGGVVWYRPTFTNKNFVAMTKDELNLAGLKTKTKKTTQQQKQDTNDATGKTVNLTKMSQKAIMLNPSGIVPDGIDGVLPAIFLYAVDDGKDSFLAFRAEEPEMLGKVKLKNCFTLQNDNLVRTALPEDEFSESESGKTPLVIFINKITIDGKTSPYFSILVD